MSRIKVDRITDKAGTGAPILVNGMNVTGKSTMGDVVGAAVTFNSVNSNGDATFSTNVTTSTLNVTGLSTFRNDLRLAESIVHLDDTNTRIRFPSADTITAETAGTERVVIKSDGKIGLGLNNPGLKLHIQDGALPSAPTPNSNCDVVLEGTTSTGIQFLSEGQTQLRFGDADSTAAGAIIYQHSADNFKLNFSNSGYLSLNDGGGENLRFTPNNEIGIAGANYGTSGQVLTSGGAGAAVQWADAGGGAWEVISSVDLGADYGQNYVDFTGITTSSGYIRYQVVFSNVQIVDNTAEVFAFRFYRGSTGALETGSQYSHTSKKSYVLNNSITQESATSNAWKLFGTSNNDMYNYCGTMSWPNAFDPANKLNAPMAICFLTSGNTWFGLDHCRFTSTNTEWISGVRFMNYGSGDNLSDGRVSLYGQKY